VPYGAQRLRSTGDTDRRPSQVIFDNMPSIIHTIAPVLRALAVTSSGGARNWPAFRRGPTQSGLRARAMFGMASDEE